MNGFIKLKITGHGLDLNEITRVLGQNPSFSYKEGERYTPKFGDKKEVIYKEDCWILETEKNKDESFDQAIEKFITEVLPSSDYIKELSNKSDITLWLSVYPDDEQCNVHLSDKTLILAGDIGISIDFNVLFLKEFYDGTYDKE